MSEAELKALGRYTIERTLGKGAMGVVYEGLDPKLNRRVAIKTILKSHLDPDTAKDYSMRFSREAQAVARLNHPHIVQVYDFAEEGDIAYLVMEFIRGKELKNFFDANERFDLKEAVRIMCELLDALEFAHNAGIIHRDIKPANVMLDAQARTKLTDFGVARVTADTDRTQAERTQAGTMVGTPAYMSPEQITGGSIDKRTDLFSAGIILYQFLTGEKPFTGGGAWTIAKKIIQEDPPLPSSLNNAVTPFFDAVVNKALSKSADTRYQSAKDFGVALKRALDGHGEEDDADKTIVGDLTPPPAARPAQPRPSAAVGGSGTQATQAGNQEVELEFWRAIKDGNDPDDFELYVQQFPTGIYAALAKRKIAKLRGAAPEETSLEAKKQEKREAEEAAQRELDARKRLADEKEKLELELAKKEEEYKQREAQREAEAKARAEAAEKAKQEAAAERERAKQEAERAKQEAAAELAKREAEYKKREAEAEAKREAAAKARAEAEAKAKAEADARAKQELAAERERARLEAEQAKKEAAAEAAKARLDADKARKDAEEKAKKETEAFAKKQAEERAKREAEFKKREAQLKAEAAAGGKKTHPAVFAGVAVAALAIGVGGYYFFAPDDAQQKQKLAEMQKQLQAQSIAAEKAKKDAEQAASALEKAKRDAEEAKKSGDLAAQKRMAEELARREADSKKAEAAKLARDAEAKKSAEAAAAAKTQSTSADKARAEKLAADRAAADQRAAAERAAAEKAANERAAAAERAANERIAAAEKAARDAAERAAAAEKAAQEKAKLAAATPTAPSGGEDLFNQAAALEQQGKGGDAVKVYVRAARTGSGKAAKRLGEIYDKGIAGVSRDYAESLKWYNAARVLGEDVPLAKNR
jgi:serine/threonine protein kinase